MSGHIFEAMTHSFPVWIGIKLDELLLAADKDWKGMVNLRDHSLAELRALDHPYAGRHATDSGPHSDDALIHARDNKLVATSSDVTRTGIEVSATLKLADASGAALLAFMRTGTKKNGSQVMRPRPAQARLKAIYRGSLRQAAAEALKFSINEASQKVKRS